MAVQDNYGGRLSLHEMIILKAIYDLGGEGVPTKEIGPYVEKRFGYDYARTTIATFLQRMAKKGYVVSYRKGRNSLHSATMSLEEYVKESMDTFCELWFDGNKTRMMRYIQKK